MLCRVNDAADSAETAAIQYVSVVTFIYALHAYTSFICWVINYHVPLWRMITLYLFVNSGMVCMFPSLVPSRDFRTRSVPLLSVSGIIFFAEYYFLLMQWNMQILCTSFHFRPVTDYNEVTLHFIQCVRMHIENTKSKVCWCDNSHLVIIHNALLEKLL